MKILKQFFSVLFVLLCVVGTGYAATFDGVRELVSRRAPWLGKHIQFKEIASSDGDCFIWMAFPCWHSNCVERKSYTMFRGYLIVEVVWGLLVCLR